MSYYLMHIMYKRNWQPRITAYSVGMIMKWLLCFQPFETSTFKKIVIFHILKSQISFLIRRGLLLRNMNYYNRIMSRDGIVVILLAL
jgi:hypothetical protein